MKVCVLGSGSSGNAIYVAAGGCGILVDAGLSRREIRARLGRIGVGLEGIAAVLLSHEHEDHIRGAAALQKACGAPVHLNRGTAAGLIERGVELGEARFFRTGVDFELGPFTVHPFPVPHDAFEPVGFVISAMGTRIGIATDLGHASPPVVEKLRGCRLIVIESNHDLDLLGGAARPASVKERIWGDHGHLSNSSAAELLADVATEALEDIFLAHLSLECNRPELAHRAALRAAAGGGFGRAAVRLTWADRVSDVVEYEE